MGLGLNESAYLAEIFRAGLKSVDNGQMEAAEALGMRRSKVMWRIILPQAMRVIIPPTGNETIGMLKTTSLVLAVPFTLDLTFVTNALASRTFLPIPLLMVAAFWYLVITSVLMVGQYYIERHFGKGVDNVMKAPVKATAAVAAAHANPAEPADRNHGRRQVMTEPPQRHRTASTGVTSRWWTSRVSTSSLASTTCSRAST